MGFSGPVGLDYASVAAIAGWMGLSPDGRLYRKIAALEAEFLGELYDAGKDETPKPCAHPDACAMCRKRCPQRVAERTNG